MSLGASGALPSARNESDNNNAIFVWDIKSPISHAHSDFWRRNTHVILVLGTQSRRLRSDLWAQNLELLGPE